MHSVEGSSGSRTGSGRGIASASRTGSGSGIDSGSGIAVVAASTAKNIYNS